MVRESPATEEEVIDSLTVSNPPAISTTDPTTVVPPQCSTTAYLQIAQVYCGGKKLKE